METAIIRIGNSQGIIIPKRMMSILGSKGRVELQAREGGLFIAPADSSPRKGWAKAFAKAAREGAPEGDMFEGIANRFDEEEWTW